MLQACKGTYGGGISLNPNQERVRPGDPLMLFYVDAAAATNTYPGTS